MRKSTKMGIVVIIAVLVIAVPVIIGQVKSLKEKEREILKLEAIEMMLENAPQINTDSVDTNVVYLSK